MLAANYSEFRSNLKDYLDMVENNNETLILKRKSGSGTVMISLEEYNSLMEMLHIKSSEANVRHLNESVKEFEDGRSFIKELID